MKPGRTAFDPEFAARVLADATIYGSDAKSAKKHKIARKTVERYRVRARADSALAENVASKIADSDERTQRITSRGLACAVERMIELFAKETDLDKVTRASKELGELTIAGGFLGVRRRDHQQGSTPSEASGVDDAEDPGSEAGGDRGPSG